jgi:hypothetical protein
MSSSIVAASTRPYSGFDPRSIGSCVLWLDAADANTITLSGSSVTQWNDKSGNGRNAIGNIGTGTYSSTGLNSLPTIQITPTGNMVSSIPAGSFSNGFVVFVVFQKTGANNTADTIVTRTATNSIPSPFDIYGGLNQPTVTIRIVGDGTNYRSNSDNPNSVTRLTSPTIWSVSVFSTTPANWLESVNGTSRTLTLSSLSGNGNYGDNANFFYIGTRGDNFTKMTGNISEIIAYNASSFSTSQLQQLEGYLAWKWGLRSNLPATHPFRNVPPYTRSLLPIDITPSLWLDAADVSTMTLSGSNVTQWNDKSGNARNAVNQQTGALLTTHVQNK